MTASTLSVSVVMTCYNEGPWIAAAVRSVLDQTRADRIVDLIVADDGSDPATLGVLADIEGWDPRIRVLRGPGGAGLPAQRCWAIGEGTGDLIALLDGDDLWEPTKLAEQLGVFDDPAIGLCYTDFFMFADGDPDSARRAGVADITRAVDLTRTYFLNDPPIVPSTVLMRREAYVASGGFDPAVRVFEDTDLFIRMSRLTRFALADQPLVRKRYRPSSITGGRKDLMAHHASVAFRAAAVDPRLLSLVPRRLAERARKLGNQWVFAGRRDDGLALLGLSLRLDPANLRTWGAWMAFGLLARPLKPWLDRATRARRRALGVGS